MESKTEFKKVLITPKLAKELLLKNNSNRRVTKSSVTTYATDMREGRWKQNTAEFIKIADDGDILDGQHRLLAIVESNCSILFDTAFNVPKSVFDVLDTGKKRSSADVFSIEKIENYAVVSASIKSYLVVSKNNSLTLKESLTSQKLTNTIILSEYERRPEFWQELVTFSRKNYKKFAHILPESSIGAMYAYFYDITPEQSRVFINQLCSGENITNTSISVLRQALLKDKISQRKMNFQDKFAIIIKTWNAFRLGKSYRIIRFNKDIEPMPRAI
jgi:hypothetical protein